MTAPDSLVEKMALFTQRGYVDSYKYGLFNLPSWLSVLNGQGAKQQGIDPFIQAQPEKQLSQIVKTFAANVQQRVQQAPNHQQFIEQYCPATNKTSL